MKDKIIEILMSETFNTSDEAGNSYIVTSSEDFDDIADRIVKLFAIPVVIKSCDTCKNLSSCRFWAEAPENGKTCKFYIEHVL